MDKTVSMMELLIKTSFTKINVILHYMVDSWKKPDSFLGYKHLVSYSSTLLVVYVYKFAYQL